MEHLWPLNLILLPKNALTVISKLHLLNLNSHLLNDFCWNLEDSDSRNTELLNNDRSAQMILTFTNEYLWLMVPTLTLQRFWVMICVLRGLILTLIKKFSGVLNSLLKLLILTFTLCISREYWVMDGNGCQCTIWVVKWNDTHFHNSREIW